MSPHYPKLSSPPSNTAAQTSPSLGCHSDLGLLGSPAGLFLTGPLPLPEVMRLSKTYIGEDCRLGELEPTQIQPL